MIQDEAPDLLSGKAEQKEVSSMVPSLPSICKNGRHMTWKQISLIYLSSTKAKSLACIQEEDFARESAQVYNELVYKFFQVIFFTFLQRNRKQLFEI